MTERQKRFCQLFAVDPDATAAAIGAGYSAKTARSIGSENLTKPTFEPISRNYSNLAPIAGLLR